MTSSTPQTGSNSVEEQLQFKELQLEKVLGEARSSMVILQENRNNAVQFQNLVAL